MINNNRRTYLISFSIRQAITRSLMTLCKDYSRNAKRTYLMKPPVIFIPARFVGEKPVATCIGKACEPFVARARNSSAPTTEVSNAAAELMGNPTLPNARLPSVDLTQSEAPPVPAHTVVPSNVVNDAINNMAPAIKHGKIESKSPPSSIETKQDSSVKDPSLAQQEYELSKFTTERQPTPYIDKLVKVEKPQKNVEANSTTGKAPENNVNIPNTETTPMPTGFSGNSTSSSSNNTGLLGTNSSTTRTTLNPENTKPVPYTDVRGYAMHTVNQPEPITSNTSAQAIQNNPPVKKGKKIIRHIETHRQECTTNPDCKNLDCPVLCGPPGDRYGVAHFTSQQNPQLEPGKQNHQGSNTNLNNQPGYQGVITYDDAHPTTNTLEHIAGTQKLNNEPALKQIILDHEDKK